MTDSHTASATSVLLASLTDLWTDLERPRMLALTEPTHGDETFLELRNQVLAHLVEHAGFTSIALETDAAAAQALDAYVQGDRDDLGTVLATGFTHGFGRYPGNRALLQLLRTVNAQRAPGDRVRCRGFDAPTELTAEAYRDPAVAERGMVERTEHMVGRLEAIAAAEEHRGPTLVHAHQAHLGRTRSTMRLGESTISWQSAGTVIAARLGGDYGVVLTSCGTSPARGVPEPPEGSVEHVLDLLLAERGLDRLVLPAAALAAMLADAGPVARRDDLTPAMALAPLEPSELPTSADGVLHVARGERGALLDQDDLRRLLGGLPDVRVEVAGPGTGAPEAAWGDTFLTVQPAGQLDDRRMPFATLVDSDYPGFDELSDLGRDGVFALNLGVGPQLFAGLLGFPPAQADHHAHRFDPTATGVLMPHPVYAAQGWVRVLRPPAAQEVQLLALAEAAAARSRPRPVGDQG